MRAVERVESPNTGQVTYRVRFRYGLNKAGTGHRQTSETFTTKREATRFAQLLEALGPQRALDQLFEEEQQARVPTLNEAARSHIEHLTGIEPGTRLNYQRLWDRTWGPLIGTLPAHHVTGDAVSEAVNQLARTYSHKSLQNQRGLLSAVLDRCVDKGHLAKNPARGIPLPRGNEGERAEMRILSDVEFEQLCDRLPSPHYRPLVRFLYGTGCRWGEAVALTVADVRLPNVTFRRALKWSPDGQRYVGATKTEKSNRTIAVPPEMYDELRELIAGRARTDLVFTAPKGGPVLHRTFWSRVWLPAVRDLDEPRPRIHDLRHSHASHLLAVGLPIHIVQARLGHSSISVTVDIYGHLQPDAQKLAAEAASLAFRRGTTPEIEG